MNKKKSPRKKTKVKKEKKKDTIPAVDRTFYELEIADLNKRIANLRLRNEELENLKENTENQIQNIQDNTKDVCGYLEREMFDKQHQIEILQEKLKQIEEEKKTEKNIFTNTEKELSIKYDEMKTKLLGKIKTQNIRINSLEGFHSQRQRLLEKFNDLKIKLQNEKSEREKIVTNYKIEAINTKQKLKEEIRDQLKQLSNDFQSVNQIRISEFVRSVFKENQKLKKEMNDLLQLHKDLQSQCSKKVENVEKIKNAYLVNKHSKLQVMKSCQYHIDIIERLTDQCELFKEKFYQSQHFKTLYEELLKKDDNEKYFISEIKEKLKIMEQRTELMKTENKELEAKNQKFKIEIDRLHEILKHIKFTIKSAIRQEEFTSKNINNYDENFNRMAFLQELFDFVSNSSNLCNVQEPSVSTVSIDSFKYRPNYQIPTAPSLLDLFQTECDNELILKEQTSQINETISLTETEKQKLNLGVHVIPCKQSALIAENNLLDVETGSSNFTISLTSESVDEVAEQEMSEDMDYDDSSEIDEVNNSKVNIEENQTQSTVNHDIIKKLTSSVEIEIFSEQEQEQLHSTVSNIAFQSSRAFKKSIFSIQKFRRSTKSHDSIIEILSDEDEK